MNGQQVTLFAGTSTNGNGHHRPRFTEINYEKLNELEDAYLLDEALEPHDIHIIHDS